MRKIEAETKQWFSYKKSVVDLIPRFARPVSQLCMVTNLMIDHIFERYADVLNPTCRNKNRVYG